MNVRGRSRATGAVRAVGALALAVALLALAGPGRADAIVGGGPADAGFVAAIDIARGGGTSDTCSGSLVSPRLVLTAAHCLKSTRPADWTVTLGRGSPAQQRFGVTGGTSYGGDVDLALIYLDRPAGRPAAGLDAGPEAAGRALVDYGDGSTVAFAPGPSSPVTKAAGVAAGVAPAGVVGPASSAPLLVIRPAHHAGGPPAGACEYGDSGGPVVLDPAGAPTGPGAQVGVVIQGDSRSGTCWAVRVDRSSPVRGWLDAAVAHDVALNAPAPAPPPAPPPPPPAAAAPPPPLPVFTGTAFGPGPPWGPGMRGSPSVPESLTP